MKTPQDFWQEWSKTKFTCKENEITPEELYQLAADYADYRLSEQKEAEAVGIKQEFYKKLLVKITRIIDGELDINAYLSEVKAKIK